MKEPDSVRKISGLVGWAIMIAGILGWDVYAIKSQKIETLSSAWWKSLQHPWKATVQLLLCSWVVWHLMLNTIARQSHTASIYTLRTKFGITEIIKE